MKRHDSLRASDADRDAVVDRLREAAGEGRLDPSEFEQRLDGALSARTYGDLARLLSDLPGEGGVPWRCAAASRRTHLLARSAALGAGVLLAATLVVALVAVVALLVLAAAAWWVAFVVFWLVCCGTRRRVAWPVRRHSVQTGRVDRTRPAGLL